MKYGANVNVKASTHAMVLFLDFLGRFGRNYENETESIKPWTSKRENIDDVHRGNQRKY
jgi:hypothetical protein